MRWRTTIQRIERFIRRNARYEAEHASVLVGTDGARWNLDGQPVDEATWCRMTARIRVIDGAPLGEPLGEPLPAAEYRAWIAALQSRVAEAHAARGIEVAERWIIIITDETPESR